MSECNRELAGCNAGCPCASAGCERGCPCPNSFCSTWRVEIDGLGIVDGTVDEVYPDVVKFLGIPFAKPPTRFAAAEMIETLGGNDHVFDAKNFGASCSGKSTSGRSEDCLNLNIYLPKSFLLENQTGPVLLNIHGGAYVGGSNKDGRLQPEHLVKEQNILVVQINYRLGYLGAWYNPETKESNFMITDQRLAMQWVQKYIDNFNGDKDRVTLSGCSAGGQSVMLHVVSEESWPYFNQAIEYSGPNGIGYFTKEEAERIYDKIAKCLDCKNAADMNCLRNRELEKIHECGWGGPMLTEDGASNISLKNRKITQLAEPYTPIIGTESLPLDPFDMIRAGIIKPRLKLVMAYTSDEAEDFIESVMYPFGFGNKKLERRESRVPRFLFNTLAKILYNNRDGEDYAESVLELYPCPKNGIIEGARDECDEQAVKWLTEWSWACNDRFALSEYLKTGGNAEIYYIEHDTPFPAEHTISENNTGRNCNKASCHCVSEYWLFGGHIRY